MGAEFKHDSGILLAQDLLARVRWEMANGCRGYPFSDPSQAPRPSEVSSKSDSASNATEIVKPETAVVSDRPAPSKSQQMADLQLELGECQRCSLCHQRMNIVFGEGNVGTDLVFVGEGPGRDEDQAGRPFVGAAGQLLSKIITAMGLRREDVYICNVVKCRPPDNRVPSPEEQLICGRFLTRQLAIIEPRVVVTLGGTATGFILEKQEPVGRLRGRFHSVGAWKVMPTYHPAYLLRNPAQKRPVWQDIQLVMSELKPGPSVAKRKG